jgi:hypothetical protein
MRFWQVIEGSVARGGKHVGHACENISKIRHSSQLTRSNPWRVCGREARIVGFTLELSASRSRSPEPDFGQIVISTHSECQPEATSSCAKPCHRTCEAMSSPHAKLSYPTCKAMSFHVRSNAIAIEGLSHPTCGASHSARIATSLLSHPPKIETKRSKTKMQQRQHD